MSRQLLVVEPDAAGRAMLKRALTTAGYTAEDFESAYDARILLDDAAFDLAVVDELAGAGAPLDEVRSLRARYPRLPLVVTGTMLSARVLIELLRLGVAGALPKPFSPAELRDAVAHALVRAAPRHDEALDYAAALAAARRELAAGRTARAAPCLARANALCPLDADVTTLEALRAELEGRDDDAARGYRAALGLRHDAGADALSPWEGLDRLARYDGARPVAALSDRFARAPLRVVGDPAKPLPSPQEGPMIAVMSLAICDDARAALHLREGATQAFALCPTDARPERLGPLLARLGARAIEADEGVDVGALRDARDAALGGARS